MIRVLQWNEKGILEESFAKNYTRDTLKEI